MACIVICTEGTIITAYLWPQNAKDFSGKSSLFDYLSNWLKCPDLRIILKFWAALAFWPLKIWPAQSWSQVPQAVGHPWWLTTGVILIFNWSNTYTPNFKNISCYYKKYLAYDSQYFLKLNQSSKRGDSGLVSHKLI